MSKVNAKRVHLHLPADAFGLPRGLTSTLRPIRAWIVARKRSLPNALLCRVWARSVVIGAVEHAVEEAAIGIPACLGVCAERQVGRVRRDGVITFAKRVVPIARARASLDIAEVAEYFRIFERDALLGN